MATCETCGNTYDKTFTITTQNASGVFDSFECAAQAMAPRCDRCGVTILGHGLENSGTMYCCAHCARHEGEEDLVDRT